MTISSEQIKKDIVDELYWDQAVDASDIIVEVRDGIVKLSGTVPSASARRAAYNDAMTIPGVVSIEDNIVVRPSTEQSSAADDELRKKVEDVLSWNADIDDTNVSVSVNAGRVTLNGFVDGCWKKVRAEELVGELAGVRDVVNTLTVVPTRNMEDKSIADSIMATLKRRTDLDVSRIDIEVNKGVVALSGVTGNPSTIRAVDYIARRTEGVVDVINRLQAQPENSPTYWRFS